MYVHVPAAWMAMMVYTLMAFASARPIIFRHPLADVAAKTAAPIGAAFCFLALVTGSLWGKPMWGTWWVWDARLDLDVRAVPALSRAHRRVAGDRGAGSRRRVAAIVALVGFVNVPIVKFSVDWWKSLHQPASVFRMGGPTIDPPMLAPLLVMALAFTPLFLTLHLTAMRAEIAAAAFARCSKAQVERAALGRGLSSSHARPRPARDLHPRRLWRDLPRRGRACLLHRR